MEAIVDLLVENPDKADEKLRSLQAEQPALAARLAKMYSNRKNNKLSDLLADADPAVASAFQNLADQVSKIQETTEKQTEAQERRLYLEWEKNHGYLRPKSEEGKTKLGKKLRDTFYDVIDEVFSEGVLSEDILEDALAIAKRRVGWKDSRVSKLLKKQAAEQAAKNRGVKVPIGGKGLKTGGKVNADKSLAQEFANDSDPKKLTERMKKVADEKKKAGY
jgi:hypothetical protein